jgi:hypothetical protein
MADTSPEKTSDEDRFNPNRLKDVSDGDKEFETELVELFNESFDESLQKLVAALDTSDKDEANAILYAHDIKGETNVVGFVEAGVLVVVVSHRASHLSRFCFERTPLTIFLSFVRVC